MKSKYFAMVTFIFIALNSCGSIYDIPEKEWRNYRAMTGKALMILWVQSFFDIEYNQPDKDCSGIFKPFLNGFGANLKTLTAWQYRNELQKYGFRRTKFNDVEVTDIVCFNLNKNKIGHIAPIVKVDKKLKKIFIVEHTEMTDGFNYRGLDFYDNRINGIYMVTPSFFYGDKLE